MTSEQLTKRPRGRAGRRKLTPVVAPAVKSQMNTALYVKQCAKCGKSILGRSTQRFCGKSCKTQYSQRKRKAAIAALVMLARRYGFTEGHAVEFVHYHTMKRVGPLLEDHFGLTYDHNAGVWKRAAAGGKHE